MTCKTWHFIELCWVRCKLSHERAKNNLARLHHHNLNKGVEPTFLFWKKQQHQLKMLTRTPEHHSWKLKFPKIFVSSWEFTYARKNFWKNMQNKKQRNWRLIKSSTLFLNFTSTFYFLSKKNKKIMLNFIFYKSKP